jgi:hypothetical protein
MAGFCVRTTDLFDLSVVPYPAVTIFIDFGDGLLVDDASGRQRRGSVAAGLAPGAVRARGADVVHGRDQLRAALAARSVVIFDMSQTWVCDLAAPGELCMAHDQARGSGRELRIVVSSAAMLHQFVLARLERNCCPTRA